MNEEDEAEYTEADYLCYEILSRLSSEQDRDITKTQFWKLACITERKLQDEHDYSTELPRYWYQYGEVPHLDQLQIQSAIDIEYDHDGAYKAVNLVESIPDSAFKVGGGATRWINQVIHSIVNEFSNSSSWTIKEHHYDHHAPHDFIREFDDFREEVRKFEPDQRSLAEFLPVGNGGSRLENLKDQLTELVRLYPEEDYTEMRSLFLRWEDTMGMLLEQGKVDEAKALTREFWQTLSRVELRVNHNHNISPSTVQRWKSKRQVEKEKFREELRDKRDAALEDQDFAGDEIDSMSDSLSQTLRNTF